MESSLILSIDRMGQRYGLLPSELMMKANTFDLVIMDSAMTIERYQQDSNQEGYIPDVGVDELLKLKERA
jgi:hypothetical protein